MERGGPKGEATDAEGEDDVATAAQNERRVLQSPEAKSINHSDGGSSQETETEEMLENPYRQEGRRSGLLSHQASTCTGLGKVRKKGRKGNPLARVRAHY
ncbi:hypothetical protein NDU88_006129 [Pleurodeles waltl]|uniref:Uncharacterized protein n=1 Tax=Pleurodeles waltl TaxID=8319 RepID=A0AAV7LRJ6_PLEWA|nr:hypothetical protein NDU88_006129 [Pleurodeles waltl]